MESITINQHPTTTTTTTTTSSALTVSEKENAALPPTCVVTRLAQMVLSTVAENVTIDVLLEPCAGDGRLGRAIAEQLLPSIPSLTSIQFDKHPLHDDGQVECIDFCDGEQVGALNQRLMMLNDSRALVIINLPYNAPRMLETLTRNAFDLYGATACALVLPGVYMDSKRLDALLPRFWHIAAFERLDDQQFHRLDTSRTELTVVLVVAVRKSYDRTSCTPHHQPVPIGFEYVAAGDSFHHAFQCGGTRRPIVVKRFGEEIQSTSAERAIYYVRYTNVTVGDLEALCELIEKRTRVMTGANGRESHRTWFPTVGSAKRFRVPQAALTDWLNHVLCEDMAFFAGQHYRSDLACQFMLGDRTAAIKAALNKRCAGALIDSLWGGCRTNDNNNNNDNNNDSNNDQYERVLGSLLESLVPPQDMMQQDDDDGGDVEEAEANDSQCRSTNEEHSTSMPKPTQDQTKKMCMELHVIYKVRATESLNNDVASPFDEGREAWHTLQSLFMQGSGALETQQAIAQRSHAIQASLGKQQNRLGFCARLHMGRALRIMKDGHGLAWKQMSWTDDTGKKLSQRTLERSVLVYDLVKLYGGLRYAWPFSRVARGSKLSFIKACEEQQLQFGGAAPLEPVETPKGILYEVPAWFLNGCQDTSSMAMDVNQLAHNNNHNDGDAGDANVIGDTNFISPATSTSPSICDYASHSFQDDGEEAAIRWYDLDAPHTECLSIAANGARFRERESFESGGDFDNGNDLKRVKYEETK